MDYSIENEYLKVTVTTYGAQLKSVIRKCDGVEHMWQADKSVWGFHAPILFPHGKPLPKFLQELCTLLPPAMMGLLLVYSLRNVSFASAGQWLPECIAIAVTAGLHLWRRNSLLSIAGGTITYMLLVQVAFA